MKHSRSLAFVSAGLIAGLVLGSVGYAVAAPADARPASPVAATGLRIGRAVRDAGARMVDTLAKLTGLNAQEIEAERADGKSVAAIAEAEGVSADAVVAATLKARSTILDARVADGTLSREAADAMLAQMSDRLEERVNTTEAGPPSWAGGGRGNGSGSGGRGGGARTGACLATQ